MMQLFYSWTDLKTVNLLKGTKLQYKEDDSKYIVFFMDSNVMYYTELWKDISQVQGIDTTQNNIDLGDFEDNYKDISNQPIEPKSQDGKSIVRAESRPIGSNTFFTCMGDSISDIGNGQEISWNFANNDNIISAPTGYKRKRIDFKFLDSVYLKEGTIYWQNAEIGSYIDIYVYCPQGYYYLDNNGNPIQAEEDTVVHKFANHHLFFGNCPMGDELNTEACSSEIPSYMKYTIEITVPEQDIISNGHVSVELYRNRSVIL